MTPEEAQEREAILRAAADAERKEILALIDKFYAPNDEWADRLRAAMRGRTKETPR